MNYNANSQNRTDYQSPLFEERYQVIVAQALKQAEGPRLIKPRERIRGWAWKVYQEK